MKKACSKCGRIHDYTYKCTPDKRIKNTNESKLRSTYKWKMKSLEIREKANYLCEVCRRENIYNYDVEVHHIESIKDNKALLLDDSNLICLCKMHHKLAEAGQISKEYLRKLAQIREQKIPSLPSTE